MCAWKPINGETHITVTPLTIKVGPKKFPNYPPSMLLVALFVLKILQSLYLHSYSVHIFPVTQPWSKQLTSNFRDTSKLINSSAYPGFYYDICLALMIALIYVGDENLV